MAIVRTAGTEIIRSIHLHEVDTTDRFLIVGEQHHIYTVLSIIIKCESVATAGNWINCYFTGYDSNGAATAVGMSLFKQEMQNDQTYVWNDKFSFNGFEPVDFAAGLDATKQNAIADQGSAVSQKLSIVAENANDNFDVFCTYIDQNNA